MDDTIIALATALGEGSIHIIRMSGPQSQEIIDSTFVPRHRGRWQENKNYTLHIGHFYGGDKILDEVLIGRMLAPSSYTGEDVYEINCHGGLFVAERIVEECLRRGARLAEAGEYSKRAFLNGKLDLIQAEAIVDLIGSKTDISADLALNQLSGHLSEKIAALREHVLETLAFIEAGIDFPEDGVESLDRNALLQRIEHGLLHAQDLLNGSRTGRILREGLITVIVGQPNVGKSSLLNALMGEDRAIVTDVPGTTRDEIRESVNVGGIVLQLVDTAGIRESNDVVEKLGIERSWKAMERADLILLLVQAGQELTTEELEILNQYAKNTIVLINKSDLLEGVNHPEEALPTGPRLGVWIPFSVKERIGFSELETEIKRRVYEGKEERAKEPLLSNIRQISALERATCALASGQESVQKGLPWDIVSIDIRQALQEISQITGDTIQESLLDDIFSRFCIGK
ncbi:tRNA modification GTPase trmE [Desulfitobacterium dichloroeliminans LMG P-21439]|uniref:tRNA modification GTPase MnmE n=1 Tax=Desulfitobacterium dichloroeliminans (strain LMG P-21439 / DCA1) TaxID=871963 RepID=L0FAS0_DESDL|nr:tRNA uridine-5-carboxymethylaminomethyl(34) synthesis GTPase MnmE [Desulfitobacterium dichloroeliminans]AGA70914.1 tRNA modification GTPase trmE [Desulfitobacterium dichloroeliminans LMG P-21439]